MIAFDRGLDFLAQHDWDVFIPDISFSYNVTPNKMTGVSPYNIIYGARVKLPIERVLSRDINAEAAELESDIRHTTGIRGSAGFSIDSTHRAYMSKMKQLHSALDEHIKMKRASYHESMKRDFDKLRVAATHYDPFEPVWVDSGVGRVGNAAKLLVNRKFGHIMDQCGDNAYIVRIADTGKYEPVNVNRIYKQIPIDINNDSPLTKSAIRHMKNNETINKKQHRDRHARQRRKKRKHNQLNIANTNANPSKRRHIHEM